MTKLSRWFGLLEMIEGPFQDDKPIFYPDNDPFVVRFHVRPVVWLPVERAIPIYEPEVWTIGTKAWLSRPGRSSITSPRRSGADASAAHADA